MAEFDSDVVIVGGGPAGLTAAVHLRRAGLRAFVLEKELFGGALQHTDVVENYPEAAAGSTGAQLAADMIAQAEAHGVRLEQADVSGIELFSRSRWVACADGRGFSCGVVILAGGTRYIRLGVANEERLRGRGVVDCTPCDGGFFVDRNVVVYGATDFAVRDALYLAGLGSRVTLLAPDATLAASHDRQTRLASTPSVAVRHGLRVADIVGTDRVEGVVCEPAGGGAHEEIAAAGVLIRLGTEPNTDGLDDIVDLDADGRIVTNAQYETSARFVLACGDIRSGAQASVAAAVTEGVAAAARAEELFRQQM